MCCVRNQSCISVATDVEVYTDRDLYRRGGREGTKEGG